MWDPRQYARFATERARPFHELVARIDVTEPRFVVDLGCGPGELTAALADRWPAAVVVGVDSSTEMVAAAGAYRRPGRVEFVTADVTRWRPDRPVDVVVANAVMQWVPGHLDLVAEISAWLAPGGALAMQVPDNFAEPSHTLLRDLRTSPRWRSRLGSDADRGAAVERPERYLETMAIAGLTPDVWQTTYLHVLAGDDAVLEWTKGTALRPVLAVLDPSEQQEFLAEYAAALRAAYPQQRFGTVFPFRRTFAVGARRA